MFSYRNPNYATKWPAERYCWPPQDSLTFIWWIKIFVSLVNKAGLYGNVLLYVFPCKTHYSTFMFTDDHWCNIWAATVQYSFKKHYAGHGEIVKDLNSKRKPICIKDRSSQASMEFFIPCSGVYSIFTIHWNKLNC